MLKLTGDKDKDLDAIANKMIELYGTPFDDVINKPHCRR